VDRVDADVKNYSFEISFRPNASVDLTKIKKKVEDAGFSVARFVAAIRFNDVRLKENELVIIGNATFSFVNTKEQSLNGVHQVKVLDKGFVSSREYKTNALPETATRS